MITQGAEGAYTAGVGYNLQLPAFRVTALDATAAGDIFCGALAIAFT